MTEPNLIIGRLLQSDCASMGFGCMDGQYHFPTLGALIRMAGSGGRQVYGLISGVGYPEDMMGLPYVKPDLEQGVVDEVIQRNGGPRISARFVGYTIGRRVVHGLPPHPPVALTEIHLCDEGDLASFTASSPGYLRLLVEPSGGDMPIDALALHIARGYTAHQAAGHPDDWLRATVRELVQLLRPDLPALRRVIYAIDDYLAITTTTREDLT